MIISKRREINQKYQLKTDTLQLLQSSSTSLSSSLTLVDSEQILHIATVTHHAFVFLLSQYPVRSIKIANSEITPKIKSSYKLFIHSNPSFVLCSHEKFLEKINLLYWMYAPKTSIQTWQRETYFITRSKPFAIYNKLIFSPHTWMPNTT